MQSTRALRFGASISRYAPKYPRPKPGTAERPAYHAPDPLLNNAKAAVTNLEGGQLTFIHRPPPTAPSPFSLTTAPSSPLLQPNSTQQTGPLPPLSRSAPKPAPLRLSDEDLAKLIELRRSDPATYTRGKLAKMFNCTQVFVGQVAPLKKPARRGVLKDRNSEHEKNRKGWSEKHSIVKAIRAKRRDLW